MKEAADAQVSPFDPAAHGFVLLRNHRLPGRVRCYEFRNHASVDGTRDHHRLNLYPTQDGRHYSSGS